MADTLPPDDSSPSSSTTPTEPRAGAGGGMALSDHEDDADPVAIETEQTTGRGGGGGGGGAVGAEETKSGDGRGPSAEEDVEAEARALFSGPHPQLAAIKTQVAAVAAGTDPDLPVIRLEPDAVTPAGLPLGEGWTWKGVFSPPSTCSYAGMTIRFQVMMPATWVPDGDELPALRVLGVLSHVSVDVLGDMEADVYAAMPTGNLSDVLRVFTSMFEAPVPTPLPSDDQLRGLWRSHPASCVCQMFPLPYSQFLMHQKDTQARELAKLSERLVKLRQMRFQAFASHEQKRQSTITAYRPRAKHPALFDGVSSPSWFDPAFLAALADGSPKALQALLTKETNGVYSFPFLTPEACRMISEEYDAYEASGLPTSRPNSMNNYGLILNDVGMEPTLDVLVRTYLKPVAAMLFPEHGGETLDHHHTFLVAYELGADRSLDFHIDDSDVTANINLVDKFDGAGLSFCGMQTDPTLRKHRLTYEHKLGRCVMHPGTLRHGAHEISGGKRVNLIVWMRSAEHRRSPDFKDAYKRTDQGVVPDTICLSRTHDPDYAEHAPASAAASGSTAGMAS